MWKRNTYIQSAKVEKWMAACFSAALVFHWFRSKAKMAAVVEANSTLVSKCMDFCQALASQGQVFNFSLSVGPTFSFSLDTTRSKAPWTKKKPSPSTLRRNARRREEFNAKKQQNSPTPEKERCPEAPNGLQMSPTHVQREENVLSEQEEAFSPASTPPSPSPVASPTASPPPPSLRYGCNKYMCTMTFTSEDDLRVSWIPFNVRSWEVLNT